MDDLLDSMTMGRDTRSFLHVESGEIRTVLSEAGWRDEEADDELYGPSWTEIPRAEGEYGWMGGFAESVAEEELRERLLDAIRGRGAFRRFKDVLQEHGDERARWFAYRRERTLAEALAWLESIGIEPEYELRPLAAAAQPTAARPPQVDLLDLLVVGAPEGKTELIEGRVRRRIELVDTARAKRAFRDVARQICGYYGVAYRKRDVADGSSFDVERMHLRVRGTVLELDIDVSADDYLRYG
jgi:hypothetical protein